MNNSDAYNGGAYNKMPFNNNSNGMTSNGITAAPPRPRKTCEQCVNLNHQLKIKDTEIRARDTRISYLQGQLLEGKDKLLAKDAQSENFFMKLSQKQEDLLKLHAKFTQVLADKDIQIQHLHQKLDRKQEDLSEKESEIKHLLEKLNLRPKDLSEKDATIQEMHEMLSHMQSTLNGYAGTMKTGKNENNRFERPWRLESADDGARVRPNGPSKNMEVSWRANGPARKVSRDDVDNNIRTITRENGEPNNLIDWSTSNFEFPDTAVFKLLVLELESSMKEDEIARAFHNQFKGAKAVNVEVPQGKRIGIITVDSEEKLQEALARGILRVHGKPLELKRRIASQKCRELHRIKYSDAQLLLIYKQRDGRKQNCLVPIPDSSEKQELVKTDIDLGYAMTVHTSQGMTLEAPQRVWVIDEHLAWDNLIYLAIDHVEYLNQLMWIEEPTDLSTGGISVCREGVLRPRPSLQDGTGTGPPVAGQATGRAEIDDLFETCLTGDAQIWYTNEIKDRNYQLDNILDNATIANITAFRALNNGSLTVTWPLNGLNDPISNLAGYDEDGYEV
ncbi:11616_t:CDS:10 [Ambispora gerdemannii]|uniref:11616_t:CDS:1 n=1 Tax=Ambispora gerdemannii TaxID=144530 RepID=A0A9N8V957_9GLOM|nr:11616_t:CDS:10 [Ambispora gerdemannii]